MLMRWVGAQLPLGTSDTSEVRLPPANLYTRIREEWETVVARMVCFADDTTLLERDVFWPIGRKMFIQVNGIICVFVTARKFQWSQKLFVDGSVGSGRRSLLSLLLDL